MDQSTTHVKLTLRSAMRQHIDPVVHNANADAALLRGASRGEKMERSQIRNVLNVAEESLSLAVVTNFIRYQMGRSRVGPAWRYNKFGLRLIEQIESPGGIVHKQAEQIVKTLRGRHTDLSEEMTKQIRYELMRYYLGYLMRAFVYGSEGPKGAWEDLRKTGGEA